MKKCFLKILIGLFLIMSCSLPLAAQYEQWNTVLGVPFLNNTGKWTRGNFEQAMRSVGLRFRGSDQLRMSRSYGLVLNMSPKEIRANYNSDGMLTVIDIVFSNKGDDATEKNIRKLIRNTFRTLEKELVKHFGSPAKCEYGHRKMQNNGLKWKCPQAEFILEYSGSEFVMLHIVFPPSSDFAGKKVEEFSAKNQDMAGNVKSTLFGDVYIENIPMVDQGSKGYCVPATVERVLKYYGINNINMHQLADAANTNQGGGTSSQAMFNGISSACRKSGLKMAKPGNVRIKTIKKYIDQGIPIFWSMYSNKPYEELRARSRRLRPQASSPKAWAKQNKKLRVPNSGSGHMCLIIGYNEEAREIAVSNSWGDDEIKPSWVPVHIASTVSQGYTVVLLPR